MTQMVGFIQKGTQKEQKNYQGIPYLFEIADWNLFVSGNTFKHKDSLKAVGFWWDSTRKAWYKNFDSAEELEKTYSKMEEKGFSVEVESIYREVKPLDEIETIKVTIKRIDGELWITSEDKRFMEVWGGGFKTSERILFLNMNELTNWAKITYGEIAEFRMEV